MFLALGFSLSQPSTRVNTSPFLVYPFQPNVHLLKEHVPCETSILAHQQAQTSHQTLAHTHTSTLSKETVLIAGGCCLGIYDMYQLTWLAPHNKLGDGDCQHLLIIPMVKILSVMSYPSIFPPGNKTGLHVVRGEDDLPSHCKILYTLSALALSYGKEQHGSREPLAHRKSTNNNKASSRPGKNCHAV